MGKLTINRDGEIDKIIKYEREKKIEMKKEILDHNQAYLSEIFEVNISTNMFPKMRGVVPPALTTPRSRTIEHETKRR
jgi:hypothetical protein